MARSLLVIIGQPGAGKTTALRLALRGVPRAIDGSSRPPVMLYPGGAQLGIERPGGFGGSDAYPMNVQPIAVAWLRDAIFKAVVTEGDRLSNDGIFQAALSFGYDLQVAWIDTPDDLAVARRAMRGSVQDPAWVRGRRTKVLRLADRWSSRVIRIDGVLSADQIAAELTRLPVIARLRESAR